MQAVTITQISFEELKVLINNAVALALLNNKLITESSYDGEPLIKDMPIEDLEISVRCFSVIKQIKWAKENAQYTRFPGLRTIKYFSQMREKDYLSFRGFGMKSFLEFKSAYLLKYGVELQ